MSPWLIAFESDENLPHLATEKNVVENSKLIVSCEVCWLVQFAVPKIDVIANAKAFILKHISEKITSYGKF